MMSIDAIVTILRLRFIIMGADTSRFAAMIQKADCYQKTKSVENRPASPTSNPAWQACLVCESLF
jgi:hypothetical protein